jgi:serine/threonine protein kinase
MSMLLSGLNEMHSTGIMHRDIKPSNLLLQVDSDRILTLKLCDFGQARVYIPETQMYSIEVGTKWYKAPEILYGVKTYSNKVDMWSAGCVLAELLDHCPLFTGSTDLDQLARIARVLGCPSSEKCNWYAEVPEYARLNLPGA